MNNLQPSLHDVCGEAPPKADTSYIMDKVLDVSYAQLSSAQKLDIYFPDDTISPYPVITAFHGGAFMGCDKVDLQILPILEGLKRGYAVVSYHNMVQETW